MTQGKIFLLAALGAGVALAGAERSGAQRPTGAVPGTYALAQVDGRALPATVDTDGACRDELVSGTLTLAEGVWTLETTERELCEGRAAREDRDTERGRYTVSGASVTFTEEDDDGDDSPDTAADTDVDVDELAAGAVDGGTLTVRLREGQTVVFRR